jgi:hypothetical protein
MNQTGVPKNICASKPENRRKVVIQRVWCLEDGDNDLGEPNIK